MPQLQTPRLILREWQDSDIATFIAMNQDKQVMEFFPELWSEEKSRACVALFRKHFAENGFGFFAVELKETHEFIGFVGISQVGFEAHFTTQTSPAVEIGWRLCSQHFNKGYATEAAHEVLRFAFENLSLEEIVSFTVQDNLPSQNVMKKIGMKRDSDGDFFHPRVPKEQKFSRHVLYCIKNREPK